MVKKEQRTGLTETAIDTTINIHKLAHRTQFKRKAPKAISEIKRLVASMMRTPMSASTPSLTSLSGTREFATFPTRLELEFLASAVRRRVPLRASFTRWFSTSTLRTSLTGLLRRQKFPHDHRPI